jgi:hypothetical protein
MESLVAVYKDLFLTRRYFIKGNLGSQGGRLSDQLERGGEDFLSLREVLMTDHRDGTVVPSPTLLLNPDEVLIAHELIETGGDVYRKVIASEAEQVYVKVVFEGVDDLTVRGKMRKDAFAPSHRSRRFLVLSQPRIEGLPETLEEHNQLIDSLSYLILNKRRIGHVFEF